MGIDATMYVKTREPVTREQLVPISYHLLQQWREHLYAGPTRWHGPFTTQAIQALRFVEDDPFAREEGFDAVEELMYDIPVSHRDKVATWIRVALHGRLYDEAYREGEALAYVAIAAWLESAIPGAVVFYGGDDGGGLEVLDRERRCELLTDYLENAPSEEGTGPACTLCTYPMHRVGSGENNEGQADARLGEFQCLGCLAVVALPGDLVHAPEPGAFRERLLQVVPWAAVECPELIGIITDAAPAVMHLWEDVTKQDMLHLLQSPVDGVRLAAQTLSQFARELSTSSGPAAVAPGREQSVSLTSRPNESDLQ